MKLTMFVPETWLAFFNSASNILAFHHITHILHRKGGSFTYFRSVLRSASNFRTCSVVFRFFVVRWATLRSRSRNRREYWMASCIAATNLSRIGLPTRSPTCCICSSYSAIWDRTPSRSRIMESTRLSSKVKVEVPPPPGLVADHVRVVRFPNINFIFLDTGRSSLLNSAISSSFENSWPIFGSESVVWSSRMI